MEMQSSESNEKQPLNRQYVTKKQWAKRMLKYHMLPKPIYTGSFLLAYTLSLSPSLSLDIQILKPKSYTEAFIDKRVMVSKLEYTVQWTFIQQTK